MKTPETDETTERTLRDIKLEKDLKTAVSTMTDDEARFLVDAYYQMQENRLRADGQVRSMEGEPHAVLEWVSDNASALEKQIAGALKAYAESQPMGRWAMAVCGIGPIKAAGLLAHLRIERWKCAHASKDRKPCAPDSPCGSECKVEIMKTAGHFWAFAGLDPSRKWEKGQKRPWNAALKRLCYLIGDGFVKVKGKPDGVYGHLYDERKKREQANNEAGKYADQAAAILKARPNHAQRAIYATGKLPPGHIHMRCARYAVKQFLSDFHAEMYRQAFGEEPPAPYPIAILGHAHHRRKS